MDRASAEPPTPHTADRLRALVAAVRPPDVDAGAAAARRFDRLAKPPGSLGALEDTGRRLAALQGVEAPRAPSDPVVVVAAGDHGVVDAGVTMWDRAVTAAMVDVCRAGGAAVNVLAATVGARVEVLDVGVAGEPAALAAAPVSGTPAGYVRRRVRRGTDDLSRGPAMSPAEAVAALLTGADRAVELMDDGADLLVTGDLGIGNTTPSTCLVAVLIGRSAGDLVGRGSGADDATLARKRRVVRTACVRAADCAHDPVAVLAECGGLEHAALAGVVLAAAARRVPVLLDGPASVAAALVATALAQPAVGACFAGHRSDEPAAAAGLEYLGLSPLLNLGLRLGEGTGGVLAVPLVRSAAAVLTDMALLSEVSRPPDGTGPAGPADGR